MTPSRASIIGATNNVAIQYNFAAMSVAVQIMNDDGYPEPAWAQMALLGTVFAGAVCGMIFLGFAGDALGRRAGMLLTLSLTVIGSAGSALFPWGSTSNIYAVISACRFVLGMGVGGMYPLSAAKVAESDDVANPSKIGWSFFWQSPGSLLPYVVGWILTAPGLTELPTSVKFRIVLGLGTIPAAVVLINEFLTPEDPEPSAIAAKSGGAAAEHKARHGAGAKGTWHTIMTHPEYGRQLIGTGGSWFLYDISYYGTAIFQPQILQSIFETKSLSYWHNLVVGSMGIPGVIVACMLLKPKGSRWLNIWGFVFIAISFAALAVCFHVSPDGLKWAKFAIFCVCTFALSMGPNVGTYVLPATLYPFAVRTTFHGLSAGSGKLGAVVGTFMYDPIAQAGGVATVLWVQTIISVLAAIVSVYCIGKNETAVELADNADEATPLDPSAGSSVNRDSYGARE